MPVIRIDASCDCEACGKRFGVEIPVTDPVANNYFADFEGVVRDIIRSGNGHYFEWIVRGQRTIDRSGLSYQPTIQGGLMLCHICSQKCDEAPFEDALTESQVREILCSH